MRDLFLIGFLFSLFAMGLRRPFLMVLAYIYIDIVSPQRLTYYLLNTVPISLIAVVAALGGWALADDKRDSRFTARQGAILLLLIYCAITTYFGADFPVEARDKWDWVWKALAFAVFLPLTLRTRLRVEALLLFMILSLSSIVIVGGIKTLFTGGGYGELNLMVVNNTGLYEGSIISAVAVAAIPVILWLMKHGTIFPPDWRVRAFGLGLIFACLLIPVGTSARTGLLCIGLLAVLMLRDVKRRLLYIGALAVAGVAVVPLLPASYTERMNTIRTYQGDESASTRLAVWKWTLDYVSSNPFGGGFNAYLQNSLRYDITTVRGSAHDSKVEQKVTTDRARAYHSSYFEMLGEQGWPGLFLWLGINIAGLLRMESLRRRYRKADDPLHWGGQLAGALQHAHLIYLLGGAFVGIAFNPFLYQLIAAQIGLDTYLSRKSREARARPDLRRARPGTPTISAPSA
ncbi:putative O-glycosylation ligase, exosortase A system-associated [Sphingomonas sp. SORGH_AS_0879]|uniref:putative O-glycosylation ligase, exosortase A system-associated n=1 Tax=Sphingomonas sp. SORGH_AS_0879 TaxID=3041790 RepID=UPI002783E11F|nr:putative O-glycosylation ligase, exosortase A system-associated [Sphingomonas sp. SORGH_AS_0879]MDQ1229974.1 putative O-glycosylation ligase (exosortase A-associated) [Sphingomonas sp. SORGH_AS_0879]